MPRLGIRRILKIPTSPMLEHDLAIVLTAGLETGSPVHSERAFEIAVVAAEKALSALVTLLVSRLAYLGCERFGPSRIAFAHRDTDWQIGTKLRVPAVMDDSMTLLVPSF